MNIIKELEDVLRKPHLMGEKGIGLNNAVNDIIHRLNELGYEIYSKEEVEKKDKKINKIKKHIEESTFEVYTRDYGNIEVIDSETLLEILGEEELIENE